MDKKGLTGDTKKIVWNERFKAFEINSRMVIHMTNVVNVEEIKDEKLRNEIYNVIKKILNDIEFGNGPIFDNVDCYFDEKENTIYCEQINDYKVFDVYLDIEIDLNRYDCENHEIIQAKDYNEIDEYEFEEMFGEYILNIYKDERYTIYVYHYIYAMIFDETYLLITIDHKKESVNIEYYDHYRDCLNDFKKFINNRIKEVIEWESLVTNCM